MQSCAHMKDSNIDKLLMKKVILERLLYLLDFKSVYDLHLAGNFNE